MLVCILVRALILFALLNTSFTSAFAEPFTYYKPGNIKPKTGPLQLSTGVVNAEVYLPDMLFPVQETPAYANSQVYNPKDGLQCYSPKINFAYPWQDNFCELRQDNGHAAGLCPTEKNAHQGQDIRPPACTSGKYRVIAVDDGVVNTRSRGTFVVFNKKTDTYYEYLHMSWEGPICDQKKAVTPCLGSKVVRGQLLGFVSNLQGQKEDPLLGYTTIHLHFGLRKRIMGKDGKYINDRGGYAYVPPYPSLIKAYERAIGEIGTALDSPLICTPDTARCVVAKNNNFKKATLITCSSDGTSETLSWCPSTTCASATTCSGGNPPPVDMAMSLPPDLSTAPIPDMSLPGPLCFGRPMPTITWTAKAALTGHRPTDSDMTVFDDQLHVFGVITAGTHRVYDPPTNTWMNKNALPGSPIMASAMSAALGNLYAFVPSLANRTFRYDKLADTWTDVGPAPAVSPVDVPLATTALGSAVYVLNGPTFSVFDTFSGSWIPAADRTRGKGILLATGGQIYAFRSLTDSSVLSRYDPPTNAWNDLGPIPLAVTARAFVAVGEVIWAFGSRDIALYSISDAAWCQTSSLSPKSATQPFVRAITGKMYFLDDTGGLFEGVIQ